MQFASIISKKYDVILPLRNSSVDLVNVHFTTLCMAPDISSYVLYARSWFSRPWHQISACFPVRVKFYLPLIVISQSTRCDLPYILSFLLFPPLAGEIISISNHKLFLFALTS